MSAEPRNSRDPNGEPEGTVFTPDALKINASLVILVKDAADILERNYPGWLWAVQPDEKGGVINIFSFRLSGQWGYTLHTSRLQADPTMRDVVRAGGELLERFGFPRGPYPSEAYRAQIAAHGMLTADVSDQSRVVQRTYRASAIRESVDAGRARIVTDADVARACQSV